MYVASQVTVRTYEHMSVKSVITDADKPFVDWKIDVEHISGATSTRASKHSGCFFIAPQTSAHSATGHEAVHSGFLFFFSSHWFSQDWKTRIASFSRERRKKNVPLVLRSDEELANQLADLDMSATWGLLGVDHKWSELGAIEWLGMSSWGWFFSQNSSEGFVKWLVPAVVL